MAPPRPNVPAATPRSKGNYSRLCSADDGRGSPPGEAAPAGDRCDSPRGPTAARSRSVQGAHSPPTAPYKAVACFALQCLAGALLVAGGCLLLAGWLGPAGPSRAVPVLAVGALVLLPGLYHLLVAWKARRGCQGYSSRDLPDWGD